MPLFLTFPTLFLSFSALFQQDSGTPSRRRRGPLPMVAVLATMATFFCKNSTLLHLSPLPCTFPLQIHQNHFDHQDEAKLRRRDPFRRWPFMATSDSKNNFHSQTLSFFSASALRHGFNHCQSISFEFNWKGKGKRKLRRKTDPVGLNLSETSTSHLIPDLA